VFKQWGRVIVETVEAEIREGTIRPDVNPEGVAAAATSFIMGAMTQLGINGRAFDFRRVSTQVASWIAKR
jgi:hypothetical protein